ncbi:MAG: lipopolysaccharide core heptose(I) kinase RfaP [Gammaproteobacteria bacterium]
MIIFCEKEWAACPKLSNFSTIMALEGTIFREQNGRRTLYFQWGQQGAFAKLHQGVGWREIFKNWLQGKHPIISAKTEWEAIQRCHGYGIPTMDLIAYGEQGWNPARRQSFLITRALAPVINLEEYCDLWKTQPPALSHKRALIAHVAYLAQKFHHAGMSHRDFYLCHFLLDTNKSQNNHFVISLIDLHRTLIHPSSVPKRWLIKDLAGLFFSSLDKGFTLRDWLRFVTVYENCSWHTLSPEKKDLWKTIYAKGLQLYHRLTPTHLNLFNSPTIEP